MLHQNNRDPHLPYPANQRSQAITRTNLAILSDWVDREPLISWIKPKSGTTTLLKYDLPLSSREFCVRLLEKTGVMLTPGSAMDMEGWLRIGYANGESILREGLSRMSKFLAEEAGDLNKTAAAG